MKKNICKREYIKKRGRRGRFSWDVNTFWIEMKSLCGYLTRGKRKRLPNAILLLKYAHGWSPICTTHNKVWAPWSHPCIHTARLTQKKKRKVLSNGSHTTAQGKRPPQFYIQMIALNCLSLAQQQWLWTELEWLSQMKKQQEDPGCD